MVWVVEKRVFYHRLDLGFESVEIPIRVKFEFEVREGFLVPKSVTRNILYNRSVLEKRYPHLDGFRLQHMIEERVDKEMDEYFREHGFSPEADDPRA